MEWIGHKFSKQCVATQELTSLRRSRMWTCTKPSSVLRIYVFRSPTSNRAIRMSSRTETYDRSDVLSEERAYEPASFQPTKRFGLYVRTRATAERVVLESAVPPTHLLAVPAIITLGVAVAVIRFWTSFSSVGVQWYAVAGAVFISACVWAPLAWAAFRAGAGPLLNFDRKSGLIEVVATRQTIPKPQLLRVELVEVLFDMRTPWSLHYSTHLDRHTVLRIETLPGFHDWICVDTRSHWGLKAALRRFASEVGVEFSQPKRVDISVGQRTGIDHPTD